MYDWWASGQPDKLLAISLPSLVLPAATATLSATRQARLEEQARVERIELLEAIPGCGSIAST